MIDTTKWTGLACLRMDGISVRWCAVALLAAALGGRAPVREMRTEAIHRVPAGRVASDPKSTPSGVLIPGARQLVVGHVDPQVQDARNAFALTAGSPCVVRFRLKATLPGADLRLRIRDRARGELAHGIEAGEIVMASAGESLDLEVRSSWGSSCYRLEIEARASQPDRAGPEILE